MLHDQIQKLYLLCLANGANVNIKDNNGQTPLHHAAVLNPEAIRVFSSISMLMLILKIIMEEHLYTMLHD